MGRIKELDGIRGLAALVVMIYHLEPKAFALAGIRVDLFLVLSGFLITRIILQKSKNPGFHRVFLVRRATRILPAYFLAMALVLLSNLCLTRPFSIAGLPYYMSFTQNLPRYWGAAPPPFHLYFLHTWSLALEQQYYFFWPLLVAVTGRRLLVPCAVVLAGASVAARGAGVHWWILPGRFEGLALGSVLAVVAEAGPDEHWRCSLLRMFLIASAAIGVGMSVVCLAVSGSWDFESSMTPKLSLAILGFNLLYFGAIGLVILSAGHPSLRVLRNRHLGHLGKVSYGLYVYHPLVFIIVVAFGRASGLGEPLWLEGVKLAACVVVASISWRWVEQPLVTLGAQYRYDHPPSNLDERANRTRRPDETSAPIRRHGRIGTDGREAREFASDQ